MSDPHRGVDIAISAADPGGGAGQQRATDDDLSRHLASAAIPATAARTLWLLHSSLASSVADADDHQLAANDGLVVAAETQAPTAKAFNHQLVEAWLAHRQITATQVLDALSVDVQADEVMPEMSQTSGGNEATGRPTMASASSKRSAVPPEPMVPVRSGTTE